VAWFFFQMNAKIHKLIQVDLVASFKSLSFHRSEDVELLLELAEILAMLVLLLLNAGHSLVALRKFVGNEIDTLGDVLLAVRQSLLDQDWSHDFVNLREISRESNEEQNR